MVPRHRLPRGTATFVIVVFVLSLTAALLYATVAHAEYRGSDPFSNIAPAPQIGGDVSKYPLTAYQLDYHVDVSLSHPSGVPAEVAQAIAQFMWTITSWLIMTVIDVLMFAFSLDLLNGGGGHGGALGPVSESIATLYNTVIGDQWLRIGVVAGSLILIWEGLVKRRYADALGQLLGMVVLIMVAWTLIFQPQMTVGRVSTWVDAIGLEVLSGVDGNVAQTPGQAKQAAANHLFDTFIVTPWKVLEFGGLKQCVNLKQTDADGFPVSVPPYSQGLGVECIPTSKYADRFLRYPPVTPERDAEYEALKNGKAPNDPQFNNYNITKADVHAVDIQQEGGAWSRLGLSFLIMVQSIGVAILFGALALGIILAGVVALLLLGFAPFMILAACIPRWGHGAFRKWLGKMTIAVCAKLGYSIIVGVLMALCLGLAAATATLGFLISFGIQCAICWIAFAKRRELFGWWGGADPHQSGFIARGGRMLMYGELMKHVMGRGGSDGKPDRTPYKSTTEGDPYTQEPAPSPEERIPDTDLRDANPHDAEVRIPQATGTGPGGTVAATAVAAGVASNGTRNGNAIGKPELNERQEDGAWRDLSRAASRLEHAALTLERAAGAESEPTRTAREGYDDRPSWDDKPPEQKPSSPEEG